MRKFLLLILLAAQTSQSNKPKPNPPQPGPGTNTISLLAMIMPTPGIPSVEFAPSDVNAQALIQQCLNFTGKCVIWYPSGRYFITKPTNLPHGVYDVYMQTDTVLVPCGQPLPYLFITNEWPRAGERNPRFMYPNGTIVDWTKQIDSAQKCGGFDPHQYFKPVAYP
jgi:hypothetical protein